MVSGPITSWQLDGEKVEAVTDFLLLGSRITVDVDCSHEIKRRLLLWRKPRTSLDRVLKSRDTTLPTKVCIVKATVFPVVMYGCENWTIERLSTKELILSNCVLKTLESPLDSKEIKPVNPKGNHSWIFIGRTDAEAPILWPPDAKSQLTGKDPDAGNERGQEEKGTTEEKMVGWHHQVNRHELSKLQEAVKG